MKRWSYSSICLKLSQPTHSAWPSVARPLQRVNASRSDRMTGKAVKATKPITQGKIAMRIVVMKF